MSVSWLMPLPDGRLDYRGIAGPPLEVVARCDETLVVWRPGYRTNLSGIRGMRDDRFIPAEHMVFRIERIADDGQMQVTRLVQWEGRGQRGQEARGRR